MSKEELLKTIQGFRKVCFFDVDLKYDFWTAVSLLDETDEFHEAYTLSLENGDKVPFSQLLHDINIMLDKKEFLSDKLVIALEQLQNIINTGIFPESEKNLKIKTLIEMATSFEEANEVIEKYTKNRTYTQKITLLNELFDSRIVFKEGEDEEADYVALLTSIVNEKFRC